MKTPDTRYGSMSIWLHWLMLLLIAAVYACIELHELFPKGSDLRETLKNWHFMLGLSVLALVSLRLLLLISSRIPPIEPYPPKWQRVSARLVHIALYVFMLGMPLAGWLILSADGKPIQLFSLQLPAIISESKDMVDLFEEIHETGANLGYFLISLHALAALFHHYVLYDNTLQRMLPGKN